MWRCTLNLRPPHPLNKRTDKSLNLIRNPFKDGFPVRLLQSIIGLFAAQKRGKESRANSKWNAEA